MPALAKWLCICHRDEKAWPELQDEMIRAMLLLELALRPHLMKLGLTPEIGSPHVGEIDLLRSVRGLPAILVEQLAEAVTMGELGVPLRLLCPESDAPHMPQDRGIEIVACRRLDDAIFATWPELR